MISILAFIFIGPGSVVKPPVLIQIKTVTRSHQTGTPKPKKIVIQQSEPVLKPIPTAVPIYIKK